VCRVDEPQIIPEKPLQDRLRDFGELPVIVPRAGFAEQNADNTNGL
jgi:hypothetical protein